MSEVIRYQQPLLVYIIWHPQYGYGAELAGRFYRHVCNDLTHPAARSIGIPVRFLTTISDVDRLRQSAGQRAAEHTALIVLVDDEMIADPAWGNRIADLWQTWQQGGDRHRLYPVTLSNYAIQLHPSIAEVNFLRPALPLEDAPARQLLNQLTHELSRLLLHQPRLTEAGQPRAAGPAPLRVFLSHAKHDGLDLAREIRAYIASHTHMNTFFDAHDIPPGTAWKQVLYEEAGDRQNALLILQTDAYSTREWCRIEVLQAKLGWVPTLLVHALRTSERRAFPYLGNVPTVIWPSSCHGEEAYEYVLGMLLYEVLRGAYFPRRVKALATLYGVSQPLKAIPYPPELLTLVAMHRLLHTDPATIFVYPDPPLGTEERRLLGEAMPHISWITPTLIPSIGRRN